MISYRVRRNRAKRNLIIIAILIISVYFFGIFIGIDKIKQNSRETTNKAINLIKESKKNKTSQSHETCINGMKVVIINNTTYYAGTVDTWGDVKTIKCE